MSENNTQPHFVDAEAFSSGSYGEGLTYKQIVINQVARLVSKGTTATQQEQIAYMKGVNVLIDILMPYFDKQFEKEYDEIIKTYKQKHNQYVEIIAKNKNNSMYKRRFGSTAKSRNVKCQKIEVVLRIVAYNIDRLMRIGKEVILIFIKITRVSY